MKITHTCWLIMLAAMLAVVGCKKGGSVDTSKLESSFAAAPATEKSSAGKAVAAVKSGDYAAALAELKTLGEKAKLTPEQQQAVKDVLAQLQQLVADTANKAAGEVGKAVDNLPKPPK
jgi:hypothetical protein